MMNLWVVVAAALLHLGAEASDVSQPHPHQGEIPRLSMDGKPEVTLSDADMKTIEAGDLWMWSQEKDGVGSGVGIRDIAAPPEVVFGQISDLEGYVGKVPMLYSLKIDSKKDGVEKAVYSIRVIPGYYFEYFVEHHPSKDKRTLLFFLDYNRSSDFSDMQGKWYLEDHPTKKGWTRVYYQCDLKLFGYAPKIVKTLLTSKGLSSSIGWVKRESEKRAPKELVVSSAAGAAPGSAAVPGMSLPVPVILGALAMLMAVGTASRRRSGPRR